MVSVHDSYKVNLLPGVDALEKVSLKFTKAKDAACTGGNKSAVGYLVAKDDMSPPIDQWDADALKAAGFEGKQGQTLTLPSATGATTVLVGIGDLADADSTTYREAGAAFVRALGKRTAGCIVLAGNVDALNVAALVEGALLAGYSFVTFKTDDQGAALEALTVVAPDATGGEDAYEAALERARALTRASFIARDLTNAPPAHLTPRTLADSAVALGEKFGFDVEIIDRVELEEMGCGGIAGVNRGSEYEARLIKLSYVPKTPSTEKKHLALVGKGITFDSGGLSLKPAAAMLDMKTDMGGAAAVLGAFTALGELGVQIPVGAWLPTTDNMISGNSMRVGEVITARNGKTVEVTNTDAEGRLILMDALSLAAETKPAWMVDIATLTGAQIVALGDDIAGILGNDEALLDSVERAADETGEAVWELPLHKRYMKIMDSSIADLMNANMSNRSAGTITAGLFLSNFVDDIPWVHVDIAGPSVSSKADRWVNSGATGFGARLLAVLAEELR